MMIAPATDTSSLSPRLLLSGGGKNGGLPALEPFGYFLMYEQTLLGTTPVAQGQEAASASTILTQLSSLLDTVSSTAPEEEFPPDKTATEEEEQILQSLLQAVQALLQPLDARIVLPGQAAEVALDGGRVPPFGDGLAAASSTPTLLGAVPWQGALRQQTQGESALSNATVFSAHAQEGALHDTAAGSTSVSSLAGETGPLAFSNTEAGQDHGFAFAADVLSQSPEGLPEHTRRSTLEQGMAQQDGRPKTATQGEAPALVDNDSATQLSLSFTAGAGAQGQAEVRAQEMRLPQQTAPLALESTGKLPEQLAPRHTLLLQLHPPELGAMQIRLRLAQEHLSASFWADSPEVRSLLQTHFPTLQQHLSEQGFHIQHMSMSLTTGDFAGGLGQFAQQHSAAQPETSRQEPSVIGARNTETMATSSAHRGLARHGGVDVVI